MQENLDDRQDQDQIQPIQSLLAVDLGLRMGLAYYESPGHLKWYRSLHVGKRADLKRAIWTILQEMESLNALVLEGDKKFAWWWRRAAQKRFSMLEHVWVIDANRWRQSLLLPRQQTSGVQAKAVAMEMAAQITRDSPLCKGTSGLRHDTAEAILIGQWGVAQLSAPWQSPTGVSK